MAWMHSSTRGLKPGDTVSLDTILDRGWIKNVATEDGIQYVAPSFEASVIINAESMTGTIQETVNIFKK